MMKLLDLLSAFLFLIQHLTLGQETVAEKIHNGIDDIVKGAIKGATEVIDKPVDVEDVKFFLFSAKYSNEANGTVDQFSPKSIALTQGNIFFFIHGWSQNRTSCPWYKPLTNLLLRKYPDSHVVQVDWGKAAQENYAFATFKSESVGQIIANVIQKLVKEYHVPLQRIFVIGHSLGGQISGWVGKEYRKFTNETLPRIIALDPAGPIFDVRPESRRLNKHDAKVVFVVHTDRLKFGFPTNCGTIDFFPNDGINQPGCLKLNLTDLSISSLQDPLWCSHRRAHDLFIEAIAHPGGFVSTKCDSYVDYQSHKCDGNIKVSMGDWQTNETGSFFLETTGEPPFIKKFESIETSRNSKASGRK
ncbi:phospholipase A1-like [Coccinella septempunctata]|uniref:phospholipase A1-like n=1 Tax=Coccinella septempunctata TaxID=41139 RepID=UPI001D079929|nr:phospholipase A1-like [Coccinella septempunctata]